MGNPKKSARGSRLRAPAILVLHGPNLNLLGVREPGIYGSRSLDEINIGLANLAASRGVALASFQSNHEGAIIDRIHAARDEGVRFIVINPGGLAHTSVALRDALTGVNIPFVEVHLSNIHAREEFRRHSLLSEKASGVVAGLGAQGYAFAVEFALDRLRGV